MIIINIIIEKFLSALLHLSGILLMQRVPRPPASENPFSNHVGSKKLVDDVLVLLLSPGSLPGARALVVPLEVDGYEMFWRAFEDYQNK